MRDDILLEAMLTFYSEPSNLNFNSAVSAHAHGDYSYIVRTENAFILAREVDDDWSDSDLVDLIEKSSSSTHLHVSLAVGCLKELAAMIPDHIKTLSFQRRGYRIHRMSVDRLKV